MPPNITSGNCCLSQDQLLGVASTLRLATGPAMADQKLQVNLRRVNHGITHHQLLHWSRLPTFRESCKIPPFSYDPKRFNSFFFFTAIVWDHLYYIYKMSSSPVLVYKPNRAQTDEFLSLISSSYINSWLQRFFTEVWPSLQGRERRPSLSSSPFSPSVRWYLFSAPPTSALNQTTRWEDDGEAQRRSRRALVTLVAELMWSWGRWYRGRGRRRWWS